MPDGASCLSAGKYAMNTALLAKFIAGFNLDFQGLLSTGRISRRPGNHHPMTGWVRMKSRILGAISFRHRLPLNTP